MKKLFLATLLMVCPLAAVPSGNSCRMISQEDRARINDERCLQDLAEETTDSPFLKSFFNTNIPVYPSSSHALFDFTGNYEFIELEDGSRWITDPEDRYLMTNWRLNDTLTITRNYDWFGPCYYRFNNMVTGQSIRVNLKEYPTQSGKYTYWIIGVDFYNHQIYLNNGTIWTIFGADWDIVKNWKTFDYVIIGMNDSYSAPTRPNILINCNTQSNLNARWDY